MQRTSSSDNLTNFKIYNILKICSKLWIIVRHAVYEIVLFPHVSLGHISGAAMHFSLPSRVAIRVARFRYASSQWIRLPPVPLLGVILVRTRTCRAQSLDYRSDTDEADALDCGETWSSGISPIVVMAGQNTNCEWLTECTEWETEGTPPV